MLFIGYKSESIRYEEAVMMNKLILDMRLRELYSVVEASPEYADLRHIHGMTDHREYWAEASASFLFVLGGNFDKGSINNFPSRNWICTEDPKLFELLKEVWPGAQ